MWLLNFKKLPLGQDKDMACLVALLKMTHSSTLFWPTCPCLVFPEMNFTNDPGDPPRRGDSRHLDNCFTIYHHLQLASQWKSPTLNIGMLSEENHEEFIHVFLSPMEFLSFF